MSLETTREMLLSNLRRKITPAFLFVFLGWLCLDLVVILFFPEYFLLKVATKVVLLTMIGVLVYLYSDRQHTWLCATWVANFITHGFSLLRYFDLVSTSAGLAVSVGMLLLVIIAGLKTLDII